MGWLDSTCIWYRLPPSEHAVQHHRSSTGPKLEYDQWTKSGVTAAQHVTLTTGGKVLLVTWSQAYFLQVTGASPGFLATERAYISTQYYKVLGAAVVLTHGVGQPRPRVTSDDGGYSLPRHPQ
ncbi:hypothetical protein AB5N19_04645 [Seiridium cardinale]